jgi:hypothetical protein
MELLDAAEGVLAYRRGADRLVAINLGGAAAPAPHAREILRATHAERLPAGAAGPRELAPGEGFVARA